MDQQQALINKIKGTKTKQPVKGTTKGTTPGTSKGITPGTGTGTISKFIFMDFCQPAKVYLIIALLTSIYYVSTGQDFIWIIVKAILFIIWGFLLNKLCTAGYKSLAWLFAIIPQAIFIVCTLKVSPALPPMPVTPQTTNGGGWLSGGSTA